MKKNKSKHLFKHFSAKRPEAFCLLDVHPYFLLLVLADATAHIWFQRPQLLGTKLKVRLPLVAPANAIVPSALCQLATKMWFLLTSCDLRKRTEFLEPFLYSWIGSLPIEISS